MSENVLPKPLFIRWPAHVWRRIGSITSVLSFVAFISGAAALFFSPARSQGAAVLNPTALSLAIVATVSAVAGIFSFNRYCALNSDDQTVALWTNLLCRILAMVELLSLAAVFAWMILHFIGLPAINHFQRFHH